MKWPKVAGIRSGKLTDGHSGTGQGSESTAMVMVKVTVASTAATAVGNGRNWPEKTKTEAATNDSDGDSGDQSRQREYRPTRRRMVKGYGHTAARIGVLLGWNFFRKQTASKLWGGLRRRSRQR